MSSGASWDPTSTGSGESVTAAPHLSTSIGAGCTWPPRRLGVDVAFHGTVAQTLPFPDASFDVVFANPGGRLLVVELARSTRKATGIFGHFDRGHRAVTLSELLEVLDGACLVVRDSGSMGTHDFHFILANAPVS